MAYESQGGLPAQHGHDKEPLPHGSNGTVPDNSRVAAEPVPVQGQGSEVMQRFWVALKRLPAYLRLASAMARDPDVPMQAKGILMAGGVYVVSPVDLVPGIIPVAGQLDDLYIFSRLFSNH